ncbi:MAG: hypothetical protein Q7K26_06340 [bacterium]|nr:hypothetical protein [bacterium]
MKKLTQLVAGISLILAASSAFSQEYTEEWRVLGPAFSKHMSKSGALITHRASNYDCRIGSWMPPGQTASDLEKLGIPSQVCSLTSHDMQSEHDAGRLDWKCDFFVKEIGIASCKFTKIEDVPTWSQNNPALGLQYSRRYGTHTDQVFGTFVKDSYGTSSFMAGAGRLWPVASISTFSVDAGIIGGAWYRSVLNIEKNTLSNRLVPYVLPALSITESRTGLGINVAFAPKTRYKGKHVVPTNTFMFQTTYLITSKKHATLLSVDVGTEKLGASVSTSF